MTDLHAFHDVWGDPRVIVWGANEDLEATRHLLGRVVDRRFNGIAHSGWFAVQQRDDGRLVGDVVLEPAYWNPELPEIGWHFAELATLRSRSTGLNRVRCRRRNGLLNSDVYGATGRRACREIGSLP